MNKLMLILQILTGLFLMLSVTLQTKGTGFTRSWKAQSSFTRRGFEKVFFKVTIIIAIIFTLVSILQLML
ncbi:preprotein translocase subunit SecG [Candidatus Woesebacteria bacterium]|nr:preprotein translocase subunit SecG [Candidatus Woesebacteria bacterium]